MVLKKRGENNSTIMDTAISREKSKGRLMVSFLKYYPVRFTDVSMESQIARDLIWGFKKGQYIDIVAKNTATKMRQCFGGRTSEMVFVCVPASTAEKNDARYREFSDLVCRLTGAVNGFDHVQIMEDRLALHENHHEKSIDTVSVINFDADFFNGREVLCFDDVITRGLSFSRFADKLETMGAKVVGGFFLGKTTYK